MNQQPKCEHCGKSVGADAPSGLCPSCLMQAGLLSEDPTVPPNPTEYYQVDASAIPPADLAPLFPNLKLVRLLGQGGDEHLASGVARGEMTHLVSCIGGHEKEVARMKGLVAAVEFALNDCHDRAFAAVSGGATLVRLQ